MATSQTYSIEVTFRNTGDDDWTVDAGFSLMAADPTIATIWGIESVDLPYSVQSSEIVTFTLTLTAPASAGSYPLSFRLAKDGLPFGTVSRLVNVSVQ
jgi:hypothetical protein